MEYLNYWERKGMKKGEKKGEKEGLKKGKLDALELLLQEKFGQLPAWVLEKLEDAEPTAMDAWFRAILNKNSLEEIFAS